MVKHRSDTFHKTDTLGWLLQLTAAKLKQTCFFFNSVILAKIQQQLKDYSVIHTNIYIEKINWKGLRLQEI